MQKEMMINVSLSMGMLGALQVTLPFYLLPLTYLLQFDLSALQRYNVQELRGETVEDGRLYRVRATGSRSYGF